ncbi:MAG: DUF2088 domain-containing protein [Anaerolineaceae bacterium]|nr:DUF2088 domain-containing protein [Anaerolineaceae bacterium]
MNGLEKADGFLSEQEIAEVVREGLGTLPLDGKRVLVLIPDGTRTMPMPLMFRLLQETLLGRAAALDFIVALGTHGPMDDAALSKLVGAPVTDGQAGASHIYNHLWMNPETFVHLGTIPAAEIGRLSGGLLEMDVPVTLNRIVLEYDFLLICGPVFPHEVVGFSGGTKYLFPGIAGAEIINFTHWLGALMTNFRIIGAGYTPVRAVIDKAAAFVDRPMACLALVVSHGGTHGLFCGTPQQAWKAASALSAKKHILYLDAPVRRVLSVMPHLYDDLWTGAKGMYKMEPVVADGGEVVIYAPHINEVSYTHGRILDEVGYHTRDYFVKQWERFRGYPWGVLAHSTHVKGMGEYDAASGVEHPRIQVTLATSIPEERARRINLGYLDPAKVKLEEWQGREAEGILVVPRAGEMLYRLKEK